LVTGFVSLRFAVEDIIEWIVCTQKWCDLSNHIANQFWGGDWSCMNTQKVIVIAREEYILTPPRIVGNPSWVCEENKNLTLGLKNTLFYHIFITNRFYSLLNKTKKNQKSKRLLLFCAKIQTQELHNEKRALCLFPSNFVIIFFYSLFHCSFFIVYCPVEPDMKYWQKYDVKLHLLIFFPASKG
jgi:hypothetical protein